MKPRRWFIDTFAIPSSVILFVAPLHVHAVDYFWDGADTTANADGGQGTWDTTSTNWDTAASGGADIAWPTSGTANIALFGGAAAGTVSVGLTTINVAGIAFSTTGYTIQGNTIRFNASGNIKVDPGVSAEIGSNLGVSGNAIDLTVLGGGTLNYPGSSWLANKLTVNGGTTVNWSGSGNVGGGNYVGLGNSSGSGVLNVTGGSLTIAPLVSNLRSFFIGSNNVNTSHLNVSGGIVTVGNNARIRIAAGINDSTADTSATSGMITVSGSGQFTTGTTSGLLAVGRNNHSTATINLEQGGTFATMRNFTTGTGATATINFNGGTLRANGNASGDWIASGITTNILAGGARIDSNGFDVTINRALLNVSGTDGGLTKTGSGTLILGGNNTYNGGTTIHQGTLRFAKTAALPDGTAARLNVKPGGTLAMNVGGADEFTTADVTTLLANLATSSAASEGMNGGSGFGFDTTNAAVGGFVIADAIADSTGSDGGARGLTKLGTGWLVLSGANTYTGPTTIKAGTLALEGSGSFANSTVITVGDSDSGAAILDLTAKESPFVFGPGQTIQGEGAIDIGAGKTVTVAGTLSPGHSTGTLSHIGDLDLSGTYTCEIDGAAADLLAVTGSLDITGATLALSTLANPTEQSYVIADYTGTLTGEFNVTGKPAGYALEHDPSTKKILLVREAGFSSWIASPDFANGSVPLDQRGASDDPDGDGLSNLLEYAIDLQDPTVASTSIGSFSANTLSFTKRAGTSGILYVIEQSTDLGLSDTWAEVPASPSYVNDTTTISYTLPGGPAKDFIRLKVTSNP